MDLLVSSFGKDSITFPPQVETTFVVICPSMVWKSDELRTKFLVNDRSMARFVGFRISSSVLYSGDLSSTANYWVSTTRYLPRALNLVIGFLATGLSGTSTRPLFIVGFIFDIPFTSNFIDITELVAFHGFG